MLARQEGGTGYSPPDKDFIFGRPLATLCVCLCLCSAVLRAFSKQTQIVGHMSGVMKFTLNVHTAPHSIRNMPQAVRASCRQVPNPISDVKILHYVCCYPGTYLNASTTFAVHVRATELGVLHRVHCVCGVTLDQAQRSATSCTSTASACRSTRRACLVLARRESAKTQTQSIELCIS